MRSTMKLIGAMTLLSACNALAQPLAVEAPTRAANLRGEEAASYSGKLSAKLSLAKRYENGDGVQKSADRAADFYAVAAMMSSADGLAKLRELAAGGNAHAQMLLGRLMLAAPTATERTEGERLLATAGDAGSAKANFILATRLATRSESIARNQAMARFTLAAKDPGMIGSYAQLLRAELKRVQPRPEAPLVQGLPVTGPAKHDFGGKEGTAYFAHWTIGKHNYFEQRVRAALVAARFFELSEAAVSRDPVASYIVLSELRDRCGERRSLDRLACQVMIDSEIFTGDSVGYQLPSIENLPNVISIGKMFEFGIDGPQDLTRARSLYERALEYDREGRGEISWRLSQLMEKGLGGPKDQNRARELLIEAADNGQPLASYRLALDMMRKGDFDGLGFYLKRAADGGNANAAFFYADFLANNKIKASRPGEKLLKYYSQAAAAGDRRAFYGMGMTYWNGRGVPADRRKARDWWEKAARLGDPKAADHVATMLMNDRDYTGAIPWLKRAAKGGYPGAEDKLQRVLAAGYRERNLGGFLMDVFDFIGDVGQSMARAYEAEYERQQAENRFSIMVNARIAASAPSGNSSSGGNAGSSGSYTSSSGASSANGEPSDSGSPGGGSSSGATGSSGQFAPNTAQYAGSEGSPSGTTSAGRTGGGADTSTTSSSQSISSGLTAGGPSSQAGTSGRGGSSDGSSSSNGAIIVSSDDAEARARQNAELQAKQQQSWDRYQAMEAARQRQIQETYGTPLPKSKARPPRRPGQKSEGSRVIPM